MARTVSFYAYLCEQGRAHAHLVPGACDHQDAAMSFAQHWSDTIEEIDVAVFENGSGVEHRFHISCGPKAH
jgi:hypothetical protein